MTWLNISKSIPDRYTLRHAILDKDALCCFYIVTSPSWIHVIASQQKAADALQYLLVVIAQKKDDLWIFSWGIQAADIRGPPEFEIQTFEWILLGIKRMNDMNTSYGNFLLSDSATWGMMAAWSRWCRMPALSPKAKASKPCFFAPAVPPRWKILDITPPSAFWFTSPITSAGPAIISYRMLVSEQGPWIGDDVLNFTELMVQIWARLTWRHMAWCNFHVDWQRN